MVLPCTRKPEDLTYGTKLPLFMGQMLFLGSLFYPGSVLCLVVVPQEASRWVQPVETGHPAWWAELLFPLIPGEEHFLPLLLSHAINKMEGDAIKGSSIRKLAPLGSCCAGEQGLQEALNS